MAHSNSCFIHVRWCYRKKGRFNYDVSNDCSHNYRCAFEGIVARPRPFVPDTEIILAADSKYAYPSDHSLIVAAEATVSVAVLYRNPSWKMKAVSMALVVEASIVCFSRIYVGNRCTGWDIIGRRNIASFLISDQENRKSANYDSQVSYQEDKYKIK